MLGSIRAFVLPKFALFKGLSRLVLLCWCGLALLGPLLPLRPDAIDLTRILAAPNATLWFGADDLGRAVFDRLVAGAQSSFLVSISVVFVSSILGTLIGAFSGYVGGKFDLILVRIMDVFLAFPGILLAIALAGFLGPGLDNLVIALSIVGWVGYARLSRAQTFSLRHREHVIAALALGETPWRILRLHLLPLLMSPVLVEASFGIAAVVIAEAGLSFLGLGIQPPDASWGSMIRDGTSYMLVAPHLVMIPGFALFLVVMAVNRVGDQLRDWLDVRAVHR